MDTIGSRLRVERERIGLTQDALASHGGIKKRALINYEQGERTPDGEFFSAVANVGIDVLYVLTGQRSAAHLSTDEQHLIALFRAASLPVKMAAVGALQGAASMQQAGVTQGTGAVMVTGGHIGGNVRVKYKKSSHE